VETPPGSGQYQFTDPQATSNGRVINHNPDDNQPLIRRKPTES